MLRLTRCLLMLCMLVSLGAAGSVPVVEAQGASEPTLVEDYATLQYGFRAVQGALTTYLAVDGVWTPTAGVVLDQLAANNTLTAVTAQFQPPWGYALHMCFRPDGEASWTCSAWTTGPVVYTMAVPGVGQSTAYEYHAAVRLPQSASTIAVHGYVGIKKLNS